MLEQRKILQSVSMSLKHLKLSLFSFNSGTNLFDDPLASLYSKTTGQLHIETAVNWSSWSFCWEASEFEAKVLLFLFKHEASHLFFESSSNTFEIQHLLRFVPCIRFHTKLHTLLIPCVRTQDTPAKCCTPKPSGTLSWNIGSIHLTAWMVVINHNLSTVRFLQFTSYAICKAFPETKG